MTFNTINPTKNKEVVVENFRDLFKPGNWICWDSKTGEFSILGDNHERMPLMLTGEKSVTLPYPGNECATKFLQVMCNSHQLDLGGIQDWSSEDFTLDKQFEGTRAERSWEILPWMSVKSVKTNPPKKQGLFSFFKK